MGSSETRSKRVVFLVGQGDNYYEERLIEFTWHMGMSKEVRQRSSTSLVSSTEQLHPGIKALEVSTKSVNSNLGTSLSAFNLKLGGYPIENIFQSSKVFNDGGPYLDLLHVTPYEAKKDDRIKLGKQHPGRRLIGFRRGDKDIPLEPKSSFYDYLYIYALAQHPKLKAQLLEYTAFTDIEFNQKIPYSTKVGPFNCQARAVAIFVKLVMNDELEDYLKNYTSYLGRIYPERNDDVSEAAQLTLLA